MRTRDAVIGRMDQGVAKMRVTIALSVVVALGLAFAGLRPIWFPDPVSVQDAHFVVSVHDDGSMVWSLEIPPNTWKAMSREVVERRADRSTMAEEVLELIARALAQHSASADRCRLVSHSEERDGWRKFDGICAWTDAPRGRSI